MNDNFKRMLKIAAELDALSEPSKGSERRPYDYEDLLEKSPGSNDLRGTYFTMQDETGSLYVKDSQGANGDTEFIMNCYKLSEPPESYKRTFSDDKEVSKVILKMKKEGIIPVIQFLNEEGPWKKPTFDRDWKHKRLF